MMIQGRAVTCLVIGLVGAALLWWCGDKTSAIIIFVAEAIVWAGLYMMTASKDE